MEKINHLFIGFYMPPKIVIFLVPKFLLLVSIALLIYSFTTIWEPIQAFLVMKFPKISPTGYQFADGTVTRIDKVRSDTYSYREGRSSGSHRDLVIIEFRDENGVPFETQCLPLFNHFSVGKKIKVLYPTHLGYLSDVKEYKKLTEDNDPENPPHTNHLHSIPLSLFYWLHRPVFFGGIACLLLIFRKIFKHMVAGYPF